MSYNRLNLERLTLTDSSGYERVRKGVLREITTPKFSIPFSTEGSKVWERVDRQNTIAAVKNRNEVVTIIRIYKCLSLKLARLFYNSDYSAINQSFNADYNSDAQLTNPKVYK